MINDCTPKGMLPGQTIKVVALTEAGKNLAQRLCDLIPEADLWYKPQPFKERVQEAFRSGSPMIFVCATGIVVRVLGPILESKLSDAPVCVLDEEGAFVIPLLSGHEGGANHWAKAIAHALGSQAVITSAHTYTDPIYAVGMGCERDCTKEEIAQLLQSCLKEAGLKVGDIANLNSIDIKHDELGLIECAAELKLDYQTWSREELLTVEDLLSTRSDYVFNTVGVYGVAESAALYSAKASIESKDKHVETLELVLNKQKSERATCAIARGFPKAV